MIQGRAVIQAVWRRFVDGFQGQGWISGNTGPRKATAQACPTYPTTQQLYQGDGDAGRPKLEASLVTSKWSARSRVRIPVGTSRKILSSLFLFQSRDNDWFLSMCLFCTWWMLNVIVMWEIALYWMNVYCNFTSENILRKRDLFKKTLQLIKLT